MTSKTMSQTPFGHESVPDDDEFVDTPGAAEELHLSESKMNKMRCTGEGPPFYKIGSRVFYSRQELREWRRSRRRMSTSIHQAA